MTTTTSDNKQLVLDLFARVNAGDIAGAGALMAEDLVNHAAIPEAQGRAGFERIIGKLRGGFPDLRMEVQDVIAADDRVVVRGTMTGTNKGALQFSNFPIPATGRAVTTEQIHVYRVANGRIVEHWSGRDDVGMFRQLGLKVSG
jgi:steroid delta-isomerase-like uncharacterized protein